MTVTYTDIQRKIDLLHTTLINEEKFLIQYSSQKCTLYSILLSKFFFYIFLQLNNDVICAHDINPTQILCLTTMIFIPSIECDKGNH